MSHAHALASTYTYHFFQSHAWDSKGLPDQHHVHKFVEEIQARLEQRHFKGWLDKQRLRVGDVLCRAILEGLLQSAVVVIYVTQHYVDKVHSGNLGDLCRREFWFANSYHGASQIILVKMDKDIGTWPAAPDQAPSSPWHSIASQLHRISPSAFDCDFSRVFPHYVDKNCQISEMDPDVATDFDANINKLCNQIQCRCELLPRVSPQAELMSLAEQNLGPDTDDQLVAGQHLVRWPRSTVDPHFHSFTIVGMPRQHSALIPLELPHSPAENHHMVGGPPQAPAPPGSLRTDSGSGHVQGEAVISSTAAVAIPTQKSPIRSVGSSSGLWKHSLFANKHMILVQQPPFPPFWTRSPAHLLRILGLQPPISGSIPCSFILTIQST